MALEVVGGDKVVLVAKGADAKAAVEKLSGLIAEGLGDEGCQPAPARDDDEAKIAEPAPYRRSDDPNLHQAWLLPGPGRWRRFSGRRDEIMVEEQGRG
jgi:phosphocarrier protein FPr